MTRNEAITELVRIWHSPHLDLILKAGLAEVIDTLKESNLNDSLVRGEVDACKESESKLDLISRQDAIDAVIRECEPICDAYDNVVTEINSLPSAEAVEGWIPLSHDDNGLGTDFPYERDGEWVIVTDGKSISVERIKKDAYDHFFPNGRWFKLEDVIAWMPMPEPYKEDNDG